jgi:predicted ATPase
MKLIKYQYRDFVGNDLHFPEIRFQDINLFVGDTGTGKTRLLNTIFSIGLNAANTESSLFAGKWDLTFSSNKDKYRWQLEVSKSEDRGPEVVKDNLYKIDSQGNETSIISRDKKGFSFLGKEMPKLPKNQTSILLLREEKDIEPIFKDFTKILQRRFSQDELAKISTYQTVPLELERQMAKKKDFNIFDFFIYNLNVRLYLLMKFKLDKYNKIINLYRSFFPNILEFSILDITDVHKNFAAPNKIPMICIKERGVNDWIELAQLSSGMQKVLLMLSDVIICAEEDAIYLIDEYENSLGLNSINFLPKILLEEETQIQFIITSHHPYIVNNFPMDKWFVFHRKGYEVSVLYGEDIIKKYGKSKQEAFIKLINDPFYNKGVE